MQHLRSFLPVSVHSNRWFGDWSFKIILKPHTSLGISTGSRYPSDLHSFLRVSVFFFTKKWIYFIDQFTPPEKFYWWVSQRLPLVFFSSNVLECQMGIRVAGGGFLFVTQDPIWPVKPPNLHSPSVSVEACFHGKMMHRDQTRIL